MGAKKTIGIVALVLVGGVGFIIFILYATIKTKSTSLNSYEPFSKWIGKTVVLNRETYLYRDRMSMAQSSAYPYTLLDSLHPQWEYFQEAGEIRDPDIEEIISFPPGTVFSIKKAVQYTDGVSGGSYPTVLGTVNHNGRIYKVIYGWGQRDMDKAFDNIEKCWYFHRAPWQNSRDTVWYGLPTAKIW